MPDNTELNLGSGGDTIATDEIAGVKHQQVKLEFGPSGTANDVAEALGKRVPVELVGGAIARGAVTNASHVLIAGNNPAVDTTSETVWEAGGVITLPTAARIHDIVSTSVADDGSPAGTGAQTITVRGINGADAEVTETITLNGTTNVPTVNSYKAIHEMRVTAVGSGGSNAGVITATAQTDSTVSDHMAVGVNRSRTALYMVPSGSTLYILQVAAYIRVEPTGGESTVDIDLFVNTGGVYISAFSFALSTKGPAALNVPLTIPQSVPALSILQMRATSTRAGMVLGVGVQCALET